MKNLFTIGGAIGGGLAVLLGAFAAHSLKQVVSANMLQVFHTGVEYQFYHSLALLFTGILYGKSKGRFSSLAGRFFITGIFLFSGSLYALALLSSLSWLGIITPLGGLCFIAGWALLLAALFREG